MAGDIVVEGTLLDPSKYANTVEITNEDYKTAPGPNSPDAKSAGSGSANSADAYLPKVTIVPEIDGPQLKDPYIVEQFNADMAKIDINAPYTVKDGDSLWKICKTELETENNGAVPSDAEVDAMVKAMARANDLSNPDAIDVGQKLKWPQPSGDAPG